MKIVFIVGSTASGKSALAFEVAKKYAGEIANADSVQIYQRVDIGSAKPSREERDLVPHHLFDLAPPGRSYTAADYRRDALNLIEEAKSRNVPVLVFVGGSGFYIQALLHGMYETPDLGEDDLRQLEADLQSMGFEEAYTELQKQDPEYAKTINENDHYRIQRAFEIMRSSGKTVSQVKAEQEASAEVLDEDYKVFGVQVDRVELRQRVRGRIEKMLQAGWIAEVEELVREGYADWDPMNSVGYAQVCEHLQTGNSEEEMIRLIENATMQLAKRQSTWFRNRVRPTWLAGEEGLPAALEEIDRFLSK